MEPGFVEDYFEHIIQSSEAEARHRQQEITRLPTQLSKVDARIEELVDVLADRTLPRDVVTKKIRAEQNRKEQIQNEIEQHKVNIPTLPLPLDTFRAELSSALQEDEETKKAAIRGLIKKIIVQPDATLRIEYAIDTGIYSYSATALITMCGFQVVVFFYAVFDFQGGVRVDRDAFYQGLNGSFLGLWLIYRFTQFSTKRVQRWW